MERVRMVTSLLLLSACTQVPAEALPSPGSDGGCRLRCDPRPLSLARAPPTIMLLLDGSGTMMEAWGNTTRWEALVQAVDEVTSRMQSSAHIGVMLFPADAVSCDAEGALVPPGPSAHDRIMDALGQVSPGGGTPMSAAVGRMEAFLGGLSTEGAAVVLVTDGVPNCNDRLDPSTCTCTVADGCEGDPRACLDDDRAVAAVRHLAAAGVPSWIVGLPGSDGVSGVLDRMALAGMDGGVPFRPADAPGLAAALAGAAAHPRTCLFTFDDPPTAEQPIDVVVGGAPAPRDRSHADGWDRTDGGAIGVYGGWCARIAEGEVAQATYCTAS